MRDKAFIGLDLAIVTYAFTDMDDYYYNSERKKEIKKSNCIEKS